MINAIEGDPLENPTENSMNLSGQANARTDAAIASVSHSHGGPVPVFFYKKATLVGRTPVRPTDGRSCAILVS
jgi:hypothetical protein